MEEEGREGELGQVGDKAGKSSEVWVHPRPHLSPHMHTHLHMHTHAHAHTDTHTHITDLRRLQAKAKGLPSTSIRFI